MIVATAGHIDHGKTSLVKVLTGIDTDRLPEEKRRGLSIDLGFAYPKDRGARLGFVDVPGHERFVRNMIAGVTAIDCALLVIAADDGPMPQTNEHLAILDMLGVSRGAIVLTKIDRVLPERIAVARLEIADLLAGSSLANAPVFPLSTITAEGVGELWHWLDAQARQFDAREHAGNFRMALDRSFTVEGAGLVVSGAVSSGQTGIDSKLVLLPQGIDVRARGIHAQNRKSQLARAGERCAINIASPRATPANVHRGNWLVAPDLFAPTLRFDARVRLLKSEARDLRHWSSVHVHIGAAAVPAHIALLEGAPLAPGETALAQIVLQSPVSALFADRFVLRDPSGQRTLGGGFVIDPFAPARGRARPERLALLEALDTDDPAAAVHGALPHSAAGFRFGDFVCARNLTSAGEALLLKSLDGLRLAGSGREANAFTEIRWKELLLAALKAVEAAHGPDGGGGVARARLQQALRPRLPAAVFEALLQDLVASGDLLHIGGQYRLRDKSVQLEAGDAAQWARLQVLLDSVRPPSIAELAGELKSDQRIVERLLQKVARLGLALQIAPNRYFLPARLRELAGFVEHVANDTPGGLVSIRAFRDKSGVGRNLSVEALEYFDRLRFTARSGEHRRICKAIADVKWVRSGS